MKTYEIIRFYAPNQNKENEVILRGLTIEQAKEHCNDESTQEEGIYFDGYNEE